MGKETLTVLDDSWGIPTTIVTMLLSQETETISSNNKTQVFKFQRLATVKFVTLCQQKCCTYF